ncbi:MAG: YlbG family protein [Leuconostoc pseudomesenteroides]|jgi:uncharacterized protein YlbG (UPF0298 family)|uniref:YlbG family protein n=1 Tax=Leuconostoc TaxID=1243 RepID=UPI0011DE0BE7|nr:MULTISPECIES: YlbG family protein [Leuconostoc]MBK0041378.1 YlbG family protein [Leuconostoc sp. S51]MBK0052258.1 YlbG family protein [Leuconostoc sp. S50]MBS0957681.1 YlbG family protein [Leuconostoc pseudomesenteroides]MCC7669654.1 DUF2129 domain-containing protein [Leuconostoc pseudomesenteroides]MCT4379933.1 DUF2129 domain-containing protein [Leuconostoc pseudomesenteroides]
MTFQIQERRAVYVYLSHVRHAQQLKKFGQITYISRKMSLVGLYLNEENVGEVVSKLQQYKFVKRVVTSPRPDIDPELGDMHDDIFFENYDEGGITDDTQPVRD